MPLLVVSCSLNTSSKSRKLASLIRQHYEHESEPCLFVDLAETTLPFCNGNSAFSHPEVQRLQDLVSQATGIILAVPVYNYSVCATAKNFIELMDAAFRGKVVGFICAAGGQKSFMAVMDLAGSLMLDFRCLIVPQFVYVDSASYPDEQALESQELHQRLHQLLGTVVRLKNVYTQTG